jgi:hypothetical protein
MGCSFSWGEEVYLEQLAYLLKEGIRRGRTHFFREEGGLALL